LSEKLFRGQIPSLGNPLTGSSDLQATMAGCLTSINAVMAHEGKFKANEEGVRREIVEFQSIDRDH
jgi:hypothetical protein